MQTLIIGYGNPLCSDDGLCWHAAEHLIGTLCDEHVRVIQCHQLTLCLLAPNLCFLTAEIRRKEDYAMMSENFYLKFNCLKSHSVPSVIKRLIILVMVLLSCACSGGGGDEGTAPSPTDVSTYKLTVAKSGTGSGIASADNANEIRCGDKCSYSYPKGTQVTLSAKPDDYSSTFAGWFGGGCGGIGDYVVTMNDNQTIQAYFTANQKVGICPGPGMFNNGLIEIVSIDPPPGTVLTRGSTVTFSGKVSYTTTINMTIGLLYVGLSNLDTKYQTGSFYRTDNMVEIETVWSETANDSGTIDFKGTVVIERRDGVSTLDSFEVFAQLLPIAPIGYLCTTMNDISSQYPVR